MDHFPPASAISAFGNPGAPVRNGFTEEALAHAFVEIVADALLPIVNFVQLETVALSFGQREFDRSAGAGMAEANTRTETETELRAGEVGTVSGDTGGMPVSCIIEGRQTFQAKAHSAAEDPDPEDERTLAGNG